MSNEAIGVHLRCEYLANPIGIGETEPRLSWQMQSERRGARQTAYEIECADNADSFAVGNANGWHSGKVTTDQSSYVVYAGDPLKSAQRVYWRVRLYDEADTVTKWSEAAFFETGLLSKADWTGDWIGAALVGGARATIPCPYLRRSLSVNKPIKSAHLHATALGLYEFVINGQKVGDDIFTPGWTDYNKRVPYQTYDVTAHLQQGENALGAILGDGWFVGHVGWSHRQMYGDRPRLLAQLHLVYADGSEETVVTNDEWKYTFGAILESDMLMGESYDARLELGDWCAPEYDTAKWQQAVVFPHYEGEISAGTGQPVRAVQELKPIAEPTEIKGWPASKYVYDLGQNMVGRIRLKVKGEAGQTITIRYAEVLDKLTTGNLYTANLRSARCTDYYTCKGDGDFEIYEPKFTFHGFRYIELAGVIETPPNDAVTGVVLMSDTPFGGGFSCNDPLVNQLQHNIQWGQRGNFLEVPTDCPQRDERLGWTGDAQVFVRTACFNASVAPFFTKWTQDLRDSQSDEGAFPSVVPKVDLSPDGGPAWADAGIICPWTIYQCYGDTRLLERHYESMKRFVAFQAETAQDNIRCWDGYKGFHGFGDWLALDGSGKTEGQTPRDLIGTAFHAYSASLLAQVADVLGNESDARMYREMFERVKAAFQKRFITGDGLLAPGTQTSYVLALYFNLMPNELRESAARCLVRDIRQRGMHLSTGFVGTSYLPHLLTDTGNAEIAFNLLFQKTWPSYLYAVTQGATTIWERWDGWTQEKGFQDVGMNSFNHYAYGAVGAWLYQRVAGIDIDPELPGYKHIVMRPLTDDARLTQAAAHVESLYGRIESAWTKTEGILAWSITVPANTMATVYLPANAGDQVTEGGAPIATALGVKLLRQEEKERVYALEAGRYSFQVMRTGTH